MAQKTITMTTNLSEVPQYAVEIGHICAEWASLEWNLYLLFHLLSDAPHAVSRNIFYCVESTRGRREMVKAVGQAVIPGTTLLAELDDVLDRIGRAARTRNKYIHDTWSVSDQQPKEVYQVRLGAKDPSRNTEGVSLTDLKRSVEQIQKVKGLLVAFREKVEPQLPAWLEKLREQRSIVLGFAKRGHPPGRKPKGFHSRPQS